MSAPRASCAEEGCPRRARRDDLFCDECGREVYGTAEIMGPLVGSADATHGPLVGSAEPPGGSR